MESSAFFSEIFYLIAGVPITFLSWVAFGFIQKNLFQRKIKILNENLARINKKWSQELDGIVDFDYHEKISFFKQCLILGVAASLFTWLGFIMSSIAWFSFFFVRSRNEVKIMSMEISSHKILSISEIEKFYQLWNK
jgi:hypothetical protein